METLPTIETSEVVENPKNLEIETRWLVDISKLPQSLDSYPNKRLIAGYFRGAHDEKIRVRQEGNKYFKVIKGPRTDEGMVRDIGPGDIEITKEEFDTVWSRTEGKRLAKTRYYIPIDNLVIELDVYDDFKDAGFYTVEVEFANSEDGKKFIPPVWFGREVTNEKGYSSRILASKGIPESFKNSQS
jgi:adenylate cyclase